ncbi:MAG TPA: tetratricopeptide repeat protein, partial [Longimicrobiales bacterium]|nr:tetratricopeptide repeat protein [Longimicrobiales bacterium]
DAGEMAEAERVLRDAVAREPEGVAGRTALGRVLARTGRLEEAAGQLREALALLPSYADAALALADLEVEREREQEGLHVLVDLLSADPYNLAGLQRIGDLLATMGREKDAGRAYERVLRFDPHHAGAHAGLLRIGLAAGHAGAEAH